MNIPVVPAVKTDAELNAPVAPAATNVAQQPAAPAPAPLVPDDANIPVAPIAKAADLQASDTLPSTNAVPVAPVAPKSDNSDGRGNAFP
jgi:hypothetical protein